MLWNILGWRMLRRCGFLGNTHNCRNVLLHGYSLLSKEIHFRKYYLYVSGKREAS